MDHASYVNVFLRLPLNSTNLSSFQELAHYQKFSNLVQNNFNLIFK